MNLKAMLANRATTTLGGVSLAALFAEIGLAMNQYFDNNPDTNPDWNVLIPLMAVTAIAVFQGLFSRDADKSSQDSGIRP